jgi:hypothetical protein
MEIIYYYESAAKLFLWMLVLSFIALAGLVTGTALFSYSLDLARVLTHNDVLFDALTVSYVKIAIAGIVTVIAVFVISLIDGMSGKAGWIFLTTSIVNAIAWSYPRITGSHAITIAFIIGTIIAGFLIGSLCDGMRIADRGAFGFVVSSILTAFFIFETAYNNMALYADLALGIDLTDTQIMSIARIALLSTVVIMIIIIASSVLVIRKH